MVDLVVTNLTTGNRPKSKNSSLLDLDFEELSQVLSFLKTNYYSFEIFRQLRRYLDGRFTGCFDSLPPLSYQSREPRAPPPATFSDFALILGLISGYLAGQKFGVIW